MKPVNFLLDAFAAALGATTVTFGPSLSEALFWIPIKSDFTPGPTLVLANTDIADFDGSTAKTIASAARTATINPLTGNRQIVLPPPAGGIAWTTTGTTNLPQTIYGVALSISGTDVTDEKLYAATKFEEPVVLTAAGQLFESEDNTITINPGAID